MATVRVYITTYKRHQLLPRALRSLQNQTFVDWVAEVHNDAPGDAVPAQLVKQLNDPRFRMVEHQSNLGACETFNLAFGGCRETFISLLEDDNWWEPNFLEKMVAEMERHPEVELAWSNMRIWQEEADGSWIDTQRFVWPEEPALESELHSWGDLRQAFGALHSNGAMLVRARVSPFWQTPKIEQSGIEAVRERIVPHPLLLVRHPLANFAVTRSTFRSHNREDWGGLQCLLTATFADAWATNPSRVEKLWQYTRSQPLRMTDMLLLASFQDSKLRFLRQPAGLKEWALFAASSLRRPLVFWHVLHARQKYPELWDLLLQHTRTRAKEALSYCEEHCGSR